MTTSSTDNTKNLPAGIGIDVVDIPRFKDAFQRQGFREKVFTCSEIEACESKPDALPSYAVRFAVKEALYKALADPSLKSVPWQQIETKIVNDIPTICLSDALRERIGNRSAFLSLTHTSQIAAAVVLLLPNSNKTGSSNIQRGSNP